MSGNNGDVPPSFSALPKYPGIIASNLSCFRSSFEGLSEQEQSQLLVILDRYVGYESNCESNRHKEEKGRQNLALASLLLVLAIVVSAFIYSAVTEDSTLAEKVIDTMIGILGGGGAAVAFVKKQA